MSHTIFAWTEQHNNYPAYVNISRDENGRHLITVRQRGHGGENAATAEVPPEMLEALLCDLAADLYRDDADRLMTMPEAEVDAELRRLGIDPAAAERQGKAAVDGALEAIRARNAGARVAHPDEVRDALARLLMAEEKYVRDTGLPQPNDLIQYAVNLARATLGWPAITSSASAGLPATSNGQENGNG